MLTPIIKTVSVNCNLKCRYCFYVADPQNNMNELMPLEVLHEMSRQVMDLNPRVVKFIWHGGEPLLGGIDFFEQVIELQRRYQRPEQICKNYLQTNGVLLTEDWARFFARHSFQVGVSLDGPREIHDQFRVDRGGRGTHERVARAIGYLKKHNVRFGIIAVVTRRSLKDPEKLLAFFRGLGIEFVSFNHISCQSVGNDFTPTPEEYGDFLRKIYDTFIDVNDASIRIRQIEQAVRLLIGGKPVSCIFSGKCDQYLTIDAMGDVYTCEMELAPTDVYLGNLLSEGGLKKILDGERFRNYLDSIRHFQVDSGCKQCEWYRICQGGCPRDIHWAMSGDPIKNSFCETWKDFFAYVEESLMQMGLPHSPGGF